MRAWRRAGRRCVIALIGAAVVGVPIGAFGSVVVGVQLGPAALPLALPVAGRAQVRPAAVTCTAPGVCVTAVNVVGPAGALARAANETQGRWGWGNRFPLPFDASGRRQSAALSSVACSGRGDCVAVGSYINRKHDTRALIVTERHGKWDAAQSIELPPGASPGSAALASVSCPASGACVAVGQYLVRTGARQALIVIERRANWGRARRLALPPDASLRRGAQRALLDTVRCPAVGDCIAGGSYLTPQRTLRAMVASETRRVWSRARVLALPAGAVLKSIACTRLRTCVGVASGTAGALTVVAEVRGRWGHPARLKLPLNAAGHLLASLTSVACVSTGTCMAVGEYATKAGEAPLVVTETNGRWHPAREVTLPVGSRPGASLSAVACAPPAVCVAVGRYDDRAGTHPMVVDLFL